nr:hypothetical protein [uncultured Actinoplanes sp.]
MNKITRALTMSGMGLIAAVLMAGPAQASGSAGEATAKSAASQSTQGSTVKQHRDRDYVAGYYRSHRACEFAGRIGERFNKWDDYDCDFVRFGFRRGLWRLEVERNFWGGGFDHIRHHNNRFFDRDHRDGRFGDKDGRFGDKDGRFGDKDGDQDGKNWGSRRS